MKSMRKKKQDRTMIDQDRENIIRNRKKLRERYESYLESERYREKRREVKQRGRN